MTSEAGCLQNQVECPPKLDCMKYSYLHGYQQKDTVVRLNHDVIVIVPGPSNDIGYCSQMALVSVCEGMMDVYRYYSDPNNATNEPISTSVKPVLHPASWFGAGVSNSKANSGQINKV
ncbi:hypothetical protein TNCV_1442151 [Trichonephila clavipes]|uniref:Uncharacterized protein n=1 Tax=Trichonephila clavipes TaxID=2585209 RepID=A0A8X6UXH7_TRICX|nr:hypothetical protein TNCV_1442151 [Trichonephila clavipes]